MAEEPGAAPAISADLWECAILERDVVAVDRALAAIPAEGFRGYLGYATPREWFVGYAARLFDHPDNARAGFLAVRAIFEKHLREQPDDALSWSLLGKVKATLGDKQQAVEAGQHACELMPVSRGATWGLVISGVN